MPAFAFAAQGAGGGGRRPGAPYRARAAVAGRSEGVSPCRDLDEIAAKVTPGAHAILVLDQAGWHGAIPPEAVRGHVAEALKAQGIDE